jgi:hypothetical protein
MMFFLGFLCGVLATLTFFGIKLALAIWRLR